MSRWTPALVLAVLASVPLWVTSLYVLHIFIIAGIFIIAAMSLNLLLGLLSGIIALRSAYDEEPDIIKD